jgi:hypothetical protein
MDGTIKRLSRVLVLDRSIEFLARVNDEEQNRWTAMWEQGQNRSFSTIVSQDEKPLKPTSNIPPPDRGSKAILFMISVFIIEAIMWGELYSFLSSTRFIFPLRFLFYHRKKDFLPFLSVGGLGGSLGQAQPCRVTGFMNRHNHAPNLLPLFS